MSSAVFKASSNAPTERIELGKLKELPRLHVAEYDGKRGVPVEDRFQTVAIEIASTVSDIESKN